jgi:hypothetical protein
MSGVAAAAHAGVKTLAAESRTAEADATAPCATDAAGNQTGNCQDSQSAAGPEDQSGAAAEGAVATPDTDTAQSGDQTGAD